MKKYPLIIGAFLLTVTSSFAIGTTFTDEASFASWYKDAVKHMQETGVVTGYADGSFKPDQSVTRGELSLMLDRYEEKVVDPKIAVLSLPTGMTEVMIDKKIADYFAKNQNKYFDNHMQAVIENTLAYEKTDYDYKTLLIMAESGLKKLNKPPVPGEGDLLDLESLKKIEANKLPEGYTLYQGVPAEGIQDYFYPPYYLNYKGEETDFMGEAYEVDEWYGPF